MEKSKEINMDGVGYNADFIRSFATEKEAADYFVQFDHLYAHLSKAEKVKKYKQLYKLCK